MKRTSHIDFEVSTSTKKRFYQIMHTLGKRKENTLIRLLDVYDVAMEGRNEQT